MRRPSRSVSETVTLAARPTSNREAGKLTPCRQTSTWPTMPRANNASSGVKFRVLCALDQRDAIVGHAIALATPAEACSLDPNALGNFRHALLLDLSVLLQGVGNGCFHDLRNRRVVLRCCDLQSLPRLWLHIHGEGDEPLTRGGDVTGLGHRCYSTQLKSS